MLNKFLISVWQQPPASLAKWAGRGINTLLDLQHGADRAQTLAAAEQAGIGCIIEPDAANPIKDVGRPGLFGFLQKPDEPENPGHVPTLDATGRKDYLAAAATWKKRYDALDVFPSIKVVGNFNGMILTAARDSIDMSKPPAERVVVKPEYQKFMEACDIVSADWHVINAARTPDKIVPLYRKMMSRLRDWSGGKLMMAFVECAYQQRPEHGRVPVATEMRAEIWSAIILGACGICYFPAKNEGGYIADNTPTDLVAEMTAQNDLIKKAEPWLLGGERTMRVESDVELGATWRLADGTEMTADVRWKDGKWECIVSVPDQTAALRAENARLKQKLANIRTIAAE